ncbi:MAG: nuclear transport factor 2 family protein [Deltaproteobacteria bacterium]|nr:nuclear transport factor 2 family protein [Deltaproteobacteria bacterium]
MPSREEIYEVVKRYADAWAANDLPTIVDSYHDEVVVHYFGRSPLAGTHTGKPACLALLMQVTAKTNRRLIAIQDVLAGAEYGAIIARERFERDGRSVEIERLLRYCVRDGRLSECWIHDEDQRLVDEYWA